MRVTGGNVQFSPDKKALTLQLQLDGAAGQPMPAAGPEGPQGAQGGQGGEGGQGVGGSSQPGGIYHYVPDDNDTF